MPTLQVDSLLFTFLPTVAAECYDKWQHYNNVWNTGGRNQKALDMVVVENSAAPTTTWLVEAKDFRVVTHPPKPSHIAGLAQTVATKTEHTLRGLEDAAIRATLAAERNHAISAITTVTKRVVLHLEPHVGPHTTLFPRRFEASVLQKLRQLVKAIDPNPLVLKIANTRNAGVPWTVV